jgi:hypothetical protein
MLPEEDNLQGRKPLSVAERLPIGAARNLNQFPPHFESPTAIVFGR